MSRPPWGPRPLIGSRFSVDVILELSGMIWPLLPEEEDKSEVEKQETVSQELAMFA